MKIKTIHRRTRTDERAYHLLFHIFCLLLLWHYLNSFCLLFSVTERKGEAHFRQPRQSNRISVQQNGLHIPCFWCTRLFEPKILIASNNKLNTAHTGHTKKKQQPWCDRKLRRTNAEKESRKNEALRKTSDDLTTTTQQWNKEQEKCELYAHLVTRYSSNSFRKPFSSIGSRTRTRKTSIKRTKREWKSV